MPTSETALETAPRRRPSIVDATLREGVQAAHTRLDEAASVEIATLLVRSGVDAIECGHPAVSELERERIRGVRRATSGTPLLCHARAVVEDVEQVASVGADWVGIFLGVNDMSLASKLHSATPEEALRRVRDSTQAARRLGLNVRFTVEDTSRTPSARALQAYRTALEAGASRLCFADTVGALAPREVEVCTRQLVAAFPDIPIEVHLHDDRGLAVANALAAIDAGATWISTSVNGLGERCGIVDLAVLLANLEYLGLRALENPAVLHELATRVGAFSRSPPDRRRPVIGENAFTHTSRLHRLAVQTDPRCYEWIEPTKLGRLRACVLTAPPYAPQELVIAPLAQSATGLGHYGRGPGTRYVMIDDRFVSEARQYCMVRSVPQLEDYGRGHVDRHAHACDSLFLFLGHSDELRGLEVEVALGSATLPIHSPAAVFIPAGLTHSYRVVSGSGLIVKHVLSGSYNESLLDPITV